ncbi:MAG TPA: glycosyltransferase family 87 protein, partial [Polyangiales bacterium]
MVAGLAWWLARYLQVDVLGWGVGNDIHAYHHYAQQWGRGGAPYVTFHPEYPPGSLVVFLAPYLVGGPEEYGRAFAIEMALFDLASLWLVLAWSRRLFSDSLRAVVLAGVGYLACTAALFPVLYTRFDLAPGALLFGALLASYTPGWWLAGAALLGVAGGVKLWPFALTPLFLLLSYRQGGWRRIALTCGGIAAGTLL